jgi:hypothetical protein
VAVRISQNLPNLTGTDSPKSVKNTALHPASPRYRISGHESFSCRYAWMPKVLRGLRRDPRLFNNEDSAMVELGLGKNMIRSARFWALAMGLITTQRSDLIITPFGATIFDENGLDPYLEDIRTLWLLHWKLATGVTQPLLAWDYLLNRWHEPELIPSTAIRALQREVAKFDQVSSTTTVDQHFNTFIHTYVPSRGRKGLVQEDNLDCPLVELNLILRVGERDVDEAREAIYVFRREDKPEITAELFLYCLDDFWQCRHPDAATLTFNELAHGHGSPGQIFKFSEDDLRSRLEAIGRFESSPFTYSESTQLQQVRRQITRNPVKLLKLAYRKG